MIDQMTILSAGAFGDYTAGNDCLVLIFKKHCPNCKVLEKVMEKCLAKLPEMKVAGVDSEESASLLADLEISKVPTLLVYKGGKLAARKTGVINPAEMMALYRNA